MAAWLFIWIYWFIQEAISAAYIVVALISFRNVQQAKPYVTNNDTYDLNAVLSALFLGVVILILFFVVSLILLLKNAINHEPLSGYGNGILLASSFHTSIFLLLTALTVYAAKNLTGNWQRNPNLAWNASDTAAYYATYVLAFILVGVYLGYAVLILVMRNVFVREEKEGKYAAPVTPAPAPVATTPYSQAPPAAAPKRGWFSRKPKAEPVTEPLGASAPGTPHPAIPAAVPHSDKPAAPATAAPAHTEATPVAQPKGAWDAV
ncbi:g1835 [Coccomyxa elongata]